MSTLPPGPGATTPAPPVVTRRGGDRTWKVVAVVAVVALAGFLTFVIVRPRHAPAGSFPTSAPTSLAVGAGAPAFSLPRLGGGAPVTLASTRGTPTVVNFFASWCRDCQAELSAFARLSSQVHGVSVVGIDSNDADGAAAGRMLAAAGASYPVGIDASATVATLYRLQALPVTYFLDRQGKVVHVAFGTQSLHSLTTWATALTSGPGTP